MALSPCTALGRQCPLSPPPPSTPRAAPTSSPAPLSSAAQKRRDPGFLLAPSRSATGHPAHSPQSCAVSSAQGRGTAGCRGGRSSVPSSGLLAPPFWNAGPSVTAACASGWHVSVISPGHLGAASRQRVSARALELTPPSRSPGPRGRVSGRAGQPVSYPQAQPQGRAPRRAPCPSRRGLHV